MFRAGSTDETFVHFVEAEADATDALTSLGAFEAFQSGIRERCDRATAGRGATIVGNYRMLSKA